MASRPSHETLLQQSGPPSKFNLESFPSEYRKVIAVGAKASQAGARGVHDPSVIEMERRLGLDPGHDAQAMARTDVAHLHEMRDQVRRRGTSAGGVATGADAAQQHAMQDAFGGGGGGGGPMRAASGSSMRIAHPEARARYMETMGRITALQNAPVQPRPVYVYGTPPERRENADAFRFTLYVMPTEGVRGKKMDGNCDALLKYTNRNCASIRDLMYVQDITSLPKLPSWLNQVPALLDRSTSNVYFGTNAKSFVDEAIGRENTATRAYVSQAMRERDQLVRSYQAEMDAIAARYGERVEERQMSGGLGAGPAGSGGSEQQDTEGGYLMPPEDEMEDLHVFDEDKPDTLDPEQLIQNPTIQSRMQRSPGQQYDATQHVPERSMPGGMRGGGGGGGQRQMISGLDISGLNLSFRK